MFETPRRAIYRPENRLFTTAKFSINKLPGTPYKHSFLLPIANAWQAYSCREQFHAAYQPAVHNGFLYLSDDIRNTAAIVNKTEFLLRLKQRSTISRVTVEGKPRPNILFISPSAFWNSQRIRANFLTCIVRASSYYNRKKDNYEKAIFSYSYLDKTKYATQRFLEGFTHSASTSGWLNVFNGQSNHSTDYLLMTPNDEHLFYTDEEFVEIEKSFSSNK